MASQPFTVDVTKTTGTILTTATAVLTVHADSDAAARRLAMEMLADDVGDVTWTAATPTTTADGSMHITSVTNTATKVTTK